MNVFYFKNINSIGGVESWFNYLSELYKDMAVYYKEADSEQIKRLAKKIKVRKFNGEKIKCDRFFCCYNPDILDYVDAKEYIHIIHCDYKKVNFSPIINDKFDKYIAVSKIAGESFKEITGIDYELIYNPIKIDGIIREKPKKLKLISATRLTKEKGLNRMKILARLLEDNNIDYEWYVYTNRVRSAIGKNVIYKEPKLDIIDEIRKSSFLVQLSDCEAFCYSLVEALMCGVPVITTDLPVLKEIGVKNGENGIICNFEMNNINLNDLEKNYEFKYKPPKSDWGKYLKEESDYNPKDKIKVKIKKRYLDIELGYLQRGQEIEMINERASYLESRDLVEIINNNTVL